MAQDISGWEKDWALMKAFFDDDEVKTVKAKIQTMAIRNVVFCSFENRFAKSGGLATVTIEILPHLKELEQVQRVLLMTPFYPHIIDQKKLMPTGVIFTTLYDKQSIEVELYKYPTPALSPGKGEIEEYYLKAGGFFGACNSINDPYGYYLDDLLRNDDAIRENALFFCKAVPLALEALGLTRDIVFHLQEWQTALIALTAKEAMLKGVLTSCGCVQTIHNPFDSWISLGALAKLTENKRIYDDPRFKINKGFTAYQVGLQLVDAPLTTVSKHFAGELTADILQSYHFAPHLQEIFNKSGIYGVNNGLFSDFPLDYSPKKEYTVEEIKKVKLKKRKALLNVLDTYHPHGRFGQLTYRSGSIKNLPDEIPILVMSGRLDFFQKGFDVLLQVVEKFTADEIKVVLTPMPVRESDLDYFYKAASRWQNNVTVFPLRMKEGYRELQMGSTFGIMPSIYEPFGAAVEYMASGTVTIARETGGLKDQVRHKVCGFMFRENPAVYTMENIKAFSKSCDNVQLRERNPWVQAMVSALYKVIKEAASFYQYYPDDYYLYISQGLKQAGTFTWQRAVEKYFSIYEKIKSF